MNKTEKAILKWHIEKTASSMEKKAYSVPGGSIPYATILGLPTAIGYGSGYGYGKVTQPTEEDLKLLQAKYVTAKLQQAMGELDDQKKLQLLKEKFSGKPNTLRI